MSMVSIVLIGSVLSIVYLSPWCQWFSLGVSCQSSIYLHGVNGSHWECFANRIFMSMVARVLIGSVYSIVHISPWCQWYSVGVYCQSYIYVHGGKGTHWECLVNRLFISMVSMVLIGSACQLPFYLHGVTISHWECLVNRLFISMVSLVLIGSACQLPFYLHGVTISHWECLANRLFISMVSMVLIGSVLSIVDLSPRYHISFGVSCQSNIYLHAVPATHCECLVNHQIISMVSMVFI